jgi:O-antigen/teichoic acid export membrane protein
MAFVVFITIVALISALSMSVGKALLFAIALLFTVVAAPIILMLLLSVVISPFTSYLRKRAQKNSSYEPANYMMISAKYGVALAQIIQIIIYVLIALGSFKLGIGYLWAALSGITVKSVFDYMWGDLPFQKQKYTLDEFGNTVSVENNRN